MKLIVFLIILIIEKLHCRSANDFLKDVFSIKDDLKEQKCSTMQCQTAEYLLKSMNRSVDPCEDFYEFTCGLWVRDHQVKDTKVSWYQYKEAEKSITNNLKEILEDNNSDTILDPAQKFYKSCLNSVNNKINIEYLKSIVSLFGGWPIRQNDYSDKLQSLDWIKMYIYMEKNWKVSTILDTGISVNYLNTSQYILMIGQPDLMLPRSMFMNPDRYKTQMNAYSKLIAGTVFLLYEEFGSRFPRSRHFGDEIADEIIKFEMQLAKIQSTGEIKKSEKVLKNRIMTIDELQKDLNNVSDTFQVDWLKMFRLLFKGTDVLLKKTEKIFVKEENYIKDLVRLLEKTPKRILINYMSWCFLRSVLSDIKEDLKNLVQDFNVVFTGDFKDISRWVDCVSITSSYFPFNVGYKYVTKYFDESAKDMAIEMVDNIQEAYMERLENIVWMDSITRQSAIDKLQSMHKFIAYPDWFHDTSYPQNKLKIVNMTDSYLMNLEILQNESNLKKLSKLNSVHNHSEWTTDIVSVNGYNDIYSNAIVLPAGMLQLPFYHKSRIQALNYGMVGLVVGHEIMHAFDDSGRMYDKHGNRRQWWTQETMETFSIKAECFVQQYNNYSLTVLGNQVKINGQMTQNENIADIGGLSHAYMAYQKYVLKHGVENRLPGLEDLSAEQLFFIGFASIWCESTTEQTLLNDLLTDVHSPGKIRVLGTLSNSNEFSKAFRCPIGSPMNPPKKCKIW
ncbi:neprilysin-11-like isoform X1 [Rhopalosiphum maidis]|uniref:neprilysin-11-like isoform X1 n=2 Tax=Rhopalosiphum maidis TaxID=43146 RepID=UPI000EFECF20|nr:neprilysin-11-like isoform X1 [Rhopalosiphum maidis]